MTSNHDPQHFVFTKELEASATGRKVLAAESHTPEMLRDFLLELERTRHSTDVWKQLVTLSKQLELPFVDFIVATNFQNWRKTLFIRTSYDSKWLNELNKNPKIGQWSYFRSHAIERLTPITIGIEYVDEYHKLPKERLAVLQKVAKLGMRAGFSIPLRSSAPPQTGLISFGGDFSKHEFNELIKEHGWTLNTAATMAYNRYMTHFLAEFPERVGITGKQCELLELIGLGLQDKTIANELSISISAVRQRMRTLLKKTGVSTRSELAALAMSVGFLPDPLNREQGPPCGIDIKIG
jgi:DNA-binding CsgD family transcriptional regulator